MNAKNKELKESTEVLAPRSPFANLLSYNEFDNFFEDFLSRRWLLPLGENFSTLQGRGFPKVDVIDYDDKIEIQAALPGVNKDAVEVSINNHLITIRASSKKEKKSEEKGKYFRQEIIRDEFQRTLSLPDNVDTDNVNAQFNDGILKITIPKTEKSKSKNIEIK